MGNLLMASVVFLGIHLLIAGTRIRSALVGAMGEKVYTALFSLASIGGIVWLAMAYNAAVVSEDNVVYWSAPIGLLHAGSLIILIAFLFAVIGLTTPNPTAAMADDLAKQPDVVKGILRITRHPFLWGVFIWSAFHMAANGDRASATFFGTFAVLSLLGTFSIDSKRRAKLGDDWDAFEKATSNIPFAAILTGRARLKIGEIGWWRIGLAILVWAGFLYIHPWLFGVSPFPAR